MSTVTNWEKYGPYFTRAEFACSHTGRCEMDEEFMDKLLAVRKECGFPIPITSAYRDRSHPVERNKPEPGEHTEGKAADAALAGWQALRFIEKCIKHGLTRIGVSQHGQGRFIHAGSGTGRFPNPAIWSYP